MKYTWYIFICSMLLLAACGGKADEKAQADNYEKGKLTVAEVEEKSPGRFLSVKGHDKRNLLGQTVIKGTLVNQAKMVSFKDVEIKLFFYSKTGVLLEEDTEVVYETLKPGEEKNFKTKYFAPKHTDSVALKVVTAKVEK